MMLYQLDSFDITFPDPCFALEEPNGLLAIGGDLSVERLINAYHHGIFPWFNDDEPLLWWSPDPRCILDLEDFHLSKSFQKFLRKTPLRLTINKHFEGVIEGCTKPRRTESGTWINPAMITAYQALHQRGFAHSIEVWDQDRLVGGLYGILVGGCFCGESMFHTEPNASKLALAGLVYHLKRHGGEFIDCQITNNHLVSLGAKEITRARFLRKLEHAKQCDIPAEVWQPQELNLLHDQL
ncbi:leucyl/phenylalanyl-tRNA--protein transferase [Algicola sagamiensis]|uniref:leucyl/phenylalanyl-tRNA--protein transferase n=1 Tax=Algicola sagamiensis TaxID=163869 RepID=UPI000376C492|nr:leucyl/phenylalanyl-tRNA--protein transferase [Algicola sagamiensis]